MMRSGPAYYSPVADSRFFVEDNRIIGYAAPAGGRLPCLLRLEADTEPIALARATRFSAEALSRGRRLGWCGVELAGLQLTAAIAPTFAVRCATTGELLLEAPSPRLAPPAPESAPLTVVDILAHARGGDTCHDVEQILPFVEATYRNGGTTGLLTATFHTILRHAVDPHAVTAWLGSPPSDPVGAVLAMVMASAEYRNDPFRFIPGPFHPAFAFDRSPLSG